MIYQTIAILTILVSYMLHGARGNDIIGGTFNKNKYSEAEVLLVKDEVGPKMCIRNCLRINACVAVNYIRAELRCELLLGTTPSSGLQDRDGTDYTEMALWKMTKGPCFPNPCTDPNRITKCVEVNHAEHICQQVATSCPFGWPQFDKKCFYLSDNTKNWQSAKNFCESFNMILAEPRTRQEIDFLKYIASLRGHEVFIGGTDRHNESNWIWANSSVGISVFDWYTNQPGNNNGNQHCLEMYADGNYRWNDLECYRTRRFICERM